MSGLGDFVDGAEHIGERLGRGVGDMADGVGQLGGRLLDSVGAHGAADDVRHAGAWTADRLGARVPESELGESDDPADLIHGDPHAVKAAAGHLRRFATAFHEVAKGMRGVDTGHWQGEAADAFHADFTPHPARWDTAGDAFEEAAEALDGYAHTVVWAQGRAADAVREYRGGERQAAHDRAAHDQAVLRYNLAVTKYDATGEGAPPARPPAEADTGSAAMSLAEAELHQARVQRDKEAAQAARLIRAALEHAPRTPGFSLSRAIGDYTSYNAVSAEHFAGGVAKSAGDLVKFVRSVDPQDPYNLDHPEFYLDHLASTAGGLAQAGNHPMTLVKSVVGTGWKNDPSQALGVFTGNLLAGALTDGSDAPEVAGADASALGAPRMPRDMELTGGRTAANKQILKDLKQVPRKIRNRVKAHMKEMPGGGTSIGEKPLSELPGGEAVDKEKWDHVQGVYLPGSRRLLVNSSLENGFTKVALHEFGHATDHAYGWLSERPEWQPLRQRMTDWLRSTGHYDTYFDSSKEMWAESFGAWCEGPQKLLEWTRNNHGLAFTLGRYFEHAL